jgi:hypothetical protein
MVEKDKKKDDSFLLLNIYKMYLGWPDWAGELWGLDGVDGVMELILKDIIDFFCLLTVSNCLLNLA